MSIQPKVKISLSALDLNFPCDDIYLGRTEDFNSHVVAFPPDNSNSAYHPFAVEGRPAQGIKEPLESMGIPYHFETLGDHYNVVMVNGAPIHQSKSRSKSGPLADSRSSLYSALSEAMSMEKRYLTSDLSIRS